MTENGGETWRKTSIAQTEEDKARTAVEDTLEFHTEKEYEDYIAVVSNKREVGIQTK